MTSPESLPSLVSHYLQPALIILGVQSVIPAGASYFLLLAAARKEDLPSVKRDLITDIALSSGTAAFATILQIATSQLAFVSATIALGIGILLALTIEKKFMQPPKGLGLVAGYQGLVLGLSLVVRFATG